MNTDYKDLSKKEQQSDIDVVTKILKDINKNPVLKNEDEPTDCPQCNESTDCPQCDESMYFDETTGWYQCSHCGFSLHHCGSPCDGYTCGD